jgi:hypothetical protein
MKKCLLATFFLAAGFISQAQIKFGAKAGANFANVSGSDAEGNKMKVDFNAGGLVNISLGKSFGLQPEVVYSGQGYKADGGDFNTSYINVPLLAQYHHAGFYGETGPQIGFLMSAKVKSNGISVDVKDQLKSTDFSWAFGVGYRHESGLGFGARYNLGLTDLADHSNVKNSVIQVGLSYIVGGNNNK